MLKTKVITQYTDRNLEKVVNAFLSEGEGRTVLSVQFAAEEDFYSALILYREPPEESEASPSLRPL